MPIALTLSRTRSLLLALPLIPAVLGAQAIPRASDAGSIRSAARSYRVANEASIVREFVDLLAIPTTSKNPGAAHRFIDYILRPEVSKLISDEFPYTNPNAAARKLLSAEQLANAASYPKLDKFKTFRDIGKAAAEIDRLVTELKSGR